MRRARTFKLGNYLYITPALAVIAFVMLVPLCYTLFISFFKVDIHTNNLTFIGIDNFKALLTVLPVEKIISLNICATMGPSIKIQK